MAIRRNMLIACMDNKRIPALYQEVEYLESQGYAQQITTNYVPTRYDQLEIQFYLIAVSGYTSIVSAGDGTYQFIALYSGSDRIYCKYFATGDAKQLTFSPQLNTWYTLSISSTGKFEIDGYSKTSGFGDALDGNNTVLRLFSRANSTSYLYGRIKECVITNNGETKLHLIPCYRKSDNKPGMYDVVSKTFYTNTGTGEFLTGPNV